MIEMDVGERERDGEEAGEDKNRFRRREDVSKVSKEE